MQEAKSEKMDRHTFFASLLLGLRLNGREEFEAEGERFHRAFLDTVKMARERGGLLPDNERWIRMDPVFKTVREANQMLLEAEHHRMLAFLNPRLRVAQFKLEQSEARAELEALVPDAVDWFTALGAHFDECLKSSAA